jgi:hypothetical protein
MRLVLSLVAVVIACGPTARPQHSASPRRCAGHREHLDLRVGQPSVASEGIRVTLSGTSHDDYDDGRFEDWAHLAFERGDRRLDVALSLYALSRR